MFKFVPPRQWTPLHWAAISGEEGTAHILIEKGADINVKDNYGVCERVCITVYQHC